MPKFTIVIPVYNRENVIARAVRSVQAQSLEDWELIIVDDGSVDRTAKVIETFLADSRIQYIWQENGGAQVARNHGLRLAKGEYISFLDSDDELLPDFLAEMLAVYETESNVGCVYCWAGMRMADGSTVVRKDTLDGDVYVAALLQGYITSPTFMTMKRSCFEKIGSWDESLKASQDDDICFRLAKYFRFKLIRKVLAVYHANYEGDENRIGASALRVAKGWFRLWQKYEDEVVKYCGERIMFKRYLRCFRDLSVAGADARDINTAWNKTKKYAVNLVEPEERELLDNCRCRSVYCYGAGKYGKTIADFLLREHISVKAFVVSNGENVISPLHGVPCIYLGNLKDDADIIVLLTVSAKYQPAMRQALGEVHAKVFSVTADLQEWLQVRLEFGRI